MGKKPILDLPLTQVLKSEIALSLQGVLNVYTVGDFLIAWRDQRKKPSIEQVFDSPQQARHAAQVCGNWMGWRTSATLNTSGAWWICDDKAGPSA